jgi:Fe-S-cluster containining protein
MAVFDMEEGTHYQCQRCTNCCQWPGEVVLTDRDVDRIAAFLGLSVYEFVARYTALRANRTGLTLTEKENSTVCEFLDGADCLINSVKPAQCAGFPNEWNFEGWRDSCEAIPVKKTVTG